MATPGGIAINTPAPSAVPVEEAPIDAAGVLSRLSWSFVTPLIRAGWARPLEASDLYELPERERAGRLADRLETAWQREVLKRGARARYWRPFLAEFGLQWLLASCWYLLEILLRMGAPLLLGVLVRAVTGEQERFVVDPLGIDWDAAVFAASGLALAAFLLAISHHFYFFGCQRVMLSAYLGTIALIMRKGMRVRPGQEQSVNLVNLISTDCQKMHDAGPFAPFVVLGLLEAAVGSTLAYLLLGRAVFAGLAFLVFVLLPVQTRFGQLFANRRTRTARETDRRVTLTGEALAGARTLKMQAWERAFMRLIGVVRGRELASIWGSSTMRALNQAIFFAGSYVTAALTFITHVYVEDEELEVDVIFTVIGLFSAMRLSLNLFFPRGVETASELWISLARIESFLLLDDLAPAALASPAAAAADDDDDDDDDDDGPKPVVSLENAFFSWTPPKPSSGKDPELSETTSLLSTPQHRSSGKAGDDGFQLKRLSLGIAPGSFTAVIGPVGSGKSSLLNAILGEMACVRGALRLSDGVTISYAPQAPWIMSATLRDNVLFGMPMDRKRFDAVIKVCQLGPDLEQLADGEDTELGERGTQVSGGQKARISLARALYRPAQLVLLDDCLSAVDPMVAGNIVRDAILGYAIDRSCTVVLVTHQLQYLADADQVIAMNAGAVVGVGTPAELREAGLMDQSMLSTTAAAAAEANAAAAAPKVDGHVDNAKGGSKERKKGDVIKAEERHRGAVSGQVYWRYFSIGNSTPLLILFAVVFVAGQAFAVLAQLFLSSWANQDPDDQAEYRNLYIYAGIVGGCLLVSIGRTLFLYAICLASSRALHRDMLGGVLLSPISFLDSQPIGRVLNRFSRDLSAADELLPAQWFDFLSCLLLTLSALGVCVAVVPFLAAALVPLGFVFLYFQRKYVASAREIKRLDAMSRSPVYATFGEYTAGLSTIRAFGRAAASVAHFEFLLDLHGRAYTAWLYTSRWIGFRLDCVAAFVTSFVALFAAFLSDQLLDASLTAVMLSYALELSGLFQYTARVASEVESNLVAVERALEFVGLEPEEPADFCPRATLPPSHAGHVKFAGYSLQYKAGIAPSLVELDVALPAGKVIGIVGRTGAGKSSMVAALFRLAPITKGAITIDGVDTQDLGLQELRRRIGVIPQEPVLFGGGASLRFNLDPFDEHDDEAVWEVLDEVELAQYVRGLPGQLSSPVGNAGEALSVGQRQLVCLARALLRRNKVMVMDEATANVDLATDSLVQRTIRERCRDSTVLIIAHRMHTILDADYILVLDSGRVVEFGPPRELLARTSGAFHEMVKRAGAAQDGQ